MNLATLLGILLLSRPHPAIQELTTSSTQCVTFSQGEVHYKRLHVWFCLDPQGNAVGAYTRRNGTIFCDITGRTDGTCVTLTACGQSKTTC